MDWILLALSCLALATALWSLALTLFRGPPAYAARLTEAEQRIADALEGLDGLSRSVARWRSRVAAAERRASKRDDDEPDDDDDGPPDPKRDPEAWKAWMNSGNASRRMINGR